MKNAPFKSGYAILDVTTGRHALARRMRKGGRVRVRVDMWLEYQPGHDDGVSIEFSGEVERVMIFAKSAKKSAPRRGRS